MGIMFYPVFLPFFVLVSNCNLGLAFRHIISYRDTAHRAHILLKLVSTNVLRAVVVYFIVRLIESATSFKRRPIYLSQGWSSVTYPSQGVSEGIMFHKILLILVD